MAMQLSTSAPQPQPPKAAAPPQPALKDRLQELLALLRALHWLYYTAHWRSKGPALYSNHLLFERLYGGLPDQFDGLAEKLVGLYGPDAVDDADSIARASAWLKRWRGANLFARAIAGETALQAMIKQLLPAVGPGMNNFLAGLADEHDVNLDFLLR